MRTIYVGGEHEVRCDGRWHWVYPADAPPYKKEPCDCGLFSFDEVRVRLCRDGHRSYVEWEGVTNG